MSSGCGDVLSLEDLKTAKKHQTFEAEVITGRAGGISSGAEIDFVANQVTGQVQKTLPAILRDMGFNPAAFDFTTGGTVTARDTVVYNPADNNWYSWSGTLPHVVAPGTNPLLDANWKPRTDQLLRQNLAAVDGLRFIGMCPSVDTLRGVTPSFNKQEIMVSEHTIGRGKAGGGVFWYDASDTSSADNNGHVIVTAGGARWKRKEVEVRPEHFGFDPTSTANQLDIIQAAIYFAVSANRFFLGSTGNTCYISSTLYIPPFLMADWRGMKVKTVTINITAVRLSSGSASIPVPYKPGSPLDFLIIEGRFNPGTTAVPDESFTTNGLVIGESTSSQVSDLTFNRLVVKGFRDSVTVAGPSAYLLTFSTCDIGVAWNRGFSWIASSNSGENVIFRGGSIYNCVNAAGSSQGVYISPTASAVELVFDGVSFDYNDYDLSQSQGNVTLINPHMENNNNNPKIVIFNTAAKEPSKLRISKGSMGGGPGSSALNPSTESPTGRPCYIDITNAGTSVIVEGTQVGLYNTSGNVTQVVRNSGNHVVRELVIKTIQNTGPSLSEGWPLNRSFYKNRLVVGQSGSTSGWTLNSGNGVTLTANTTVSAAHDSGSRLMTRSALGSATSMSFYQDIKVSNDETIVYKSWLMTEGVKAIGGVAALQISFLNEDKSVTIGTPSVSQRQVSADSVLTECAYVAPVPQGAGWMRCGIYVTAIPVGTEARVYSSGERAW